MNSKKSDLDGFVKSSNSRRANFAIMRRTYRTLNDYEMQHNAEVGLFTKPSLFIKRCKNPKNSASDINPISRTLSLRLMNFSYKQ